MALRIQIAKFKFHQYLLRANVMLAKFSHYRACIQNPIYGIHNYHEKYDAVYSITTIMLFIQIELMQCQK